MIDSCLHADPFFWAITLSSDLPRAMVDRELVSGRDAHYRKGGVTCVIVWFLRRCGGVEAARFGLVIFLVAEFDILPGCDDALPLCTVYCRFLFLTRPALIFAGADTRPALRAEVTLPTVSILQITRSSRGSYPM